SPSTDYDVPFYITKEMVMDVDLYRNFVKNCVYRFRRSRYYKQYKAYLIGLGLDHSQILGNIDDTMADIEMHHAILTIFDITLMITEHLLNTVGRATSFDVIQLLIEEHHQNNIPIAMLDKTSHEMVHSDMDNFLPPNMIFGMWPKLLYKYRYGISMEVAKKILMYISRYYKDYPPMSVQLRSEIMTFAHYNEFGAPYNESMAIEAKYTEV
ncbi:MAG: hypothetical protein J6X45_04370, partial [Lachnospiraceae bacterium]|nr:hypothetical protein [Lachnospiraceae bacterium]